MRRSSGALQGATAVAMVLLFSCGGRAALADLAKLEEKTCGCKGNAKCRREAEAEAKKWVAAHGKAPIGDAHRAEELVNSIATCELDVALALAEAP